MKQLRGFYNIFWTPVDTYVLCMDEGFNKGRITTKAAILPSGPSHLSRRQVRAFLEPPPPAGVYISVRKTVPTPPKNYIFPSLNA
jgi:hypothetical protein